MLPLLNDLRAVRGQRLLSETRLFSPDLSAAKQVRGSRSPALKNPNLKAMLQKLRQMYQYAAAGYIRNVNAEENLAYILKVSDRVAKLTTGTPRYPLWEIMLAVGEALQQGTLQPSVAFKVLLRKLDKELKALAIGGIAAFEGFNSEALTKNFLYYVSSSESVTPRAQALREKYGIEQALPETDFTSSAQSLMDPDAMETVVAALKDEMETVKHALDIGISGSDHAAVEEALPVMQRVADTLEILGVGELRQQVLKQIESLNQYAGGQEPPADLLMKIASEMLGMEQRLTAMTAAASRSIIGEAEPGKAHLDIGHAQEAVLLEARNDLEKAKDSIIEFIASQWDISHLQPVPDLLNEARGGLSMIPLARPSSILQACCNYIERELIEQGTVPDWGHLDTLADAIASVEYYLERLTGDASEDDESLMEIAENSVASLGYPVSGYKAISAKSSSEESVDAEQVLNKIADVEAVEIDSLPPEEPQTQEITLADELADLDFSGEEVIEVILDTD
ncbi:MAG: histidine kinase, partial [Pseudomonadota bacterium]|nr:histidine kinase [Pseudomonadota bacterium]